MGEFKEIHHWQSKFNSDPHEMFEDPRWEELATHACNEWCPDYEGCPYDDRWGICRGGSTWEHIQWVEYEPDDENGCCIW